VPALPFVLKRSDVVLDRMDVSFGAKVTSTKELIHGLLRADREALVVQWRVGRETEHVGTVIRTDHEYEPVRELRIPLSGLAAAAVRRRRWLWFKRGIEIVVTASDLSAFEEVTGEAGLKLKHPAALTLPIPRNHELAALEFAADLNLLLADRQQIGLSDALQLDQPARVPLKQGDES
jgi:hypothetical protein